MSESPQEYTKRILATLGGEEPLAILSATPSKLKALTLGRSTEELTRYRARGKWSVAEILSHLADVEMVIGYRIRTILANHGTPIQAFDQNEWARVAQYGKIPVAHSLETQRALREWNVALLRSLTPQQWELHGIHAERGKESIAHTTAMIAGHDINHLRQIEENLGIN